MNELKHKRIALITGANQLEAILIGERSDVWGLDPKSTYKMVEDDNYTRE